MLVTAGKDVGETSSIKVEEPDRLLSLVTVAAGQEACHFTALYSFPVLTCYLYVEFHGPFSAKWFTGVGRMLGWVSFISFVSSMQYLEASRLCRSFVQSQLLSSHCQIWTVKKNQSSYVAVATLTKNLITVDQTVAREKLSEWWSQESYCCPHFYRVKPQECEEYNYSDFSFIQWGFRIIFAPVVLSL